MVLLEHVTVNPVTPNLSGFQSQYGLIRTGISGAVSAITDYFNPSMVLLEQGLESSNSIEYLNFNPSMVLLEQVF